MNHLRVTQLAALSAAISITGCSSMSNYATTTTTPVTPAAPAAVIAQLATTTTIGSTVDPTNGDANPYGLAIAPITAGLMTAGDLIVCNFNDSKGNAGAGTTIVDLKPVAGSKPTRIAQDATLAGCNSLALNPGGNIWAAAYTANDNPIFTPSGTLATSLSSSYAWMQPWGQVFATPTLPAGSTATAPKAFYITDAGDGSVIQSNITSAGLVFNKIITGFPHTVSTTYGILAPAGLTYDPSTDTLYVVSSDTNSVLAFSAVSTIPAGGVVINFTPGSSTGGSYPTTTAAAFSFTGSAAAQASVIYSGTPLNYPISAALLYNGDLVVGNTGDNNLVEIQPSTKAVLGTKSVDTGNPGAIFGIVTSGTTLATQKIFFNDDNANTVIQISQ